MEYLKNLRCATEAKSKFIIQNWVEASHEKHHVIMRDI